MSEICISRWRMKYISTLSKKRDISNLLFESLVAAWERCVSYLGKDLSFASCKSNFFVANCRKVLLIEGNRALGFYASEPFGFAKRPELF